MKKFLESFTRKKCKQQIKKSLELKINKKKTINYMLSGKNTIICLVAG